MSDIITTLHPENDANTNLYPNIKKENIPNNSIDRSKLDNDVNGLLNNIGELHPSGVDTSTNILAKTSDTGIWVGSDTGKWYYWDGSHYVEGGDFISSNGNVVYHYDNQLKDNDNNNLYPNLSPSLYYKNETLVWNYLSYNGYSAVNNNTTYILDNLIVSACVLSKIKLYAHSTGIVNIYLLQQNSGTYFTAYKKISLNVVSGEHTYYLDDEIIVNDNTYIAVNGANIICYKNTTQNGSYTNNLYQIASNVVLGTSQFYSKIDNIKFSFMFEIYTYKRTGSIGKLLNTFSNTIIVDTSGNGDYTTIQEAVDNTSPLKNYIYIKSGVYEEEVDARKTYPIYLIGENRETTILKSGYAKYIKPPLFHNMGCVKNMTIIAYNDGVHAPDPEAQTTGEQWGAYAIHCDSWDSSNNSYDIDNCTVISYWNSAIGIGTYSNYGVTIRNSDLLSYNQYFTSQSNNNGAIIIHDRINTSAIGQYVTLDNCKLYAKYGSRVINIQTLQDEGEFKLTFHNNSLYNENTNKTGNSVVWITHNYNYITSFEQAPEVVHSGLSFGNSADILNY